MKMQKQEQYPLEWSQLMHSVYGDYSMHRNMHPSLVPMVANAPMKYSHDSYVKTVRIAGQWRIRRLLEKQRALRDKGDEVIKILEQLVALFEDAENFNIDSANTSLDLAISEVNGIGRLLRDSSPVDESAY